MLPVMRLLSRFPGCQAVSSRLELWKNFPALHYYFVLAVFGHRFANVEKR